ncbi:MAG: sugar phosphate isomerase/epimerase [Bryobacteraceae bacterium]|nr:sugar phosphate isomerase/epimerase [Bryobacteraceae bacterium]
MLAEIKRHGFDGVELPLFDPANCPAGEIRRALESNALECTACTVIPQGMTIFDADASIRRRACQHLEDTVKVLAEIGGKLLAGPVYSPVGWLPGKRRTTEEWQRAIESYQQLAEVLEQFDVTLAIEPLNRFETFFLNTVADGVALCEAVNHSRIGLLVDTFHSNIEEKNIAAAYRLAGRHLRHVHTCENDRGTPGSGHIPWPDVLNAVKSVGYDGWLTIESFGFHLPEISQAAAIWRDLAAAPEAIAWEGVRFLKQSLS